MLLMNIYCFLPIFVISSLGIEVEQQDGIPESQNEVDLSGINSTVSANSTQNDLKIEGRSFGNPCAYNPCLNRGLCTWDGIRILCKCPNGYSGTTCEINYLRSVDDCSNNPCQNGGICKPYTGPTFTCDCAASFSGLTCQRKSTPGCTPNPCLNGGQCYLSPAGGYFCLCPSTHAGSTCGIRIGNSKCEPNPCWNGGTCIVTTDGFICVCAQGFGGSRCEIHKSRAVDNACSTNPCANGGLCVEDPIGAIGNAYQCICPQGFFGTRCDISDPGNAACAPNPCKGDCRCVESCRHSSGYYCQSPTGFLGKDCTIPPPVLRCDRNRLTIVVDDAFVREYEQGVANAKLVMARTANTMTRAGEDCQAKFDGARHTFSIHLPFAQCGTRMVRSTEGSAVFMNNIWLNRMIGVGFDMPVPVISFECAYQKDYSIVTSLQPANSQPPIVQQSGQQVLQGKIELCKQSGACPKKCPLPFSLAQGAVYTVGELLHLNLHGSDDYFQTVALQDLFLTCNSPSLDNVVPLVSNGCPTGSLPTVITHSGISPSVCVSFQVPRLHNCNKFFIHAKMESCPESGCATLDPHIACSTSGRRKRNAEDMQIETYIGDIVGPIHTLPGSEGIGKEFMFPDLKRVNYSGHIIDNKPKIVHGITLHDVRLEDDGSSEVHTTMLLIVVTSFCLVVFCIVLFVAYIRISKKC